jgi:aminopeptidase
MFKPQEFNIEVLASKTVDMLDISPGKVIWIWANAVSLDLIEALAYRIRAGGAFWSLRLTSESLLRRLGLDLPREYLAQVPEHELRWLEDVDAIIEVHDHGGDLPDVPLERRRAMGSEWIALIDAADRKGIRRVMVLNPTPSLASAYALPQKELQTRIMRATEVDYAAVDALQARLAGHLTGVDEVHITSPGGTDLHLRVAGRKPLTDTDSLPHGEMYIAPLEDSARGVAVIDKAFFRGRFVEQLQLTFSEGRLVTFDAPDPAGVTLLRELLEASSGDKDRLAELGFGANPGVTEPIGIISLDEKLAGSVHIAIGMNDRFGGRNRSNLHQDFVILKPTVWFDGKKILENGGFRLQAK